MCQPAVSADRARRVNTQAASCPDRSPRQQITSSYAQQCHHVPPSPRRVAAVEHPRKRSWRRTADSVSGVLRPSPWLRSAMDGNRQNSARHSVFRHRGRRGDRPRSLAVLDAQFIEAKPDGRGRYRRVSPAPAQPGPRCRNGGHMPNRRRRLASSSGKPVGRHPDLTTHPALLPRPAGCPGRPFEVAAARRSPRRRRAPPPDRHHAPRAPSR